MAPAGDNRDDELAERSFHKLKELLSLRHTAGFEEARETLLAEARPFVRASVRALAAEAAHDALAWSEARSLLWLLSYRLGLKELSPFVVAALLPAWRDAVDPPASQALCDELGGLVLDAYGRGRHDTTREQLCRALAASLPLLCPRPGVLLGVLHGPLEADAVRPFLERVSREVSRAEATALVLDALGLGLPDAAVLAELEALCARVQLVGVSSALVLCPEARESLGGTLPHAGALFESAQEALASLREGAAPRPNRPWLERLRGLFGRAS